MEEISRVHTWNIGMEGSLGCVHIPNEQSRIRRGGEGREKKEID